MNANASEQQSQLTSVAIPPDELYSFFFVSVEEEMISDGSYLFAITVEFIRSANLEKIKLNPNIYVLAARLLARNERHAELGLFVTNKVKRGDYGTGAETNGRSFMVMFLIQM